MREYVRRGLPGLTLLASRPTGTLAPEYAQLLDEPGAELIELSPLSEDDALDLAAERLGAAWLGAGVSELILDRAAGNPLFVEELARALADAGVIRVDASGTCMVAPGADLDDLGLPDTVEGVIANRMEGLDPPVDLTLKVSASSARRSPRELVRDVYPLETDAARLESSLDALVRRDLTQLIQPPPGTSYSFRHALIRDVAYQRLLFGQRRELHRAIGEWHELHFAGNLAPVYATLAHHYTRAGDVERACDYLGRASVQAINNGMGREAVDLGLAAAAMLGVELPRTLPEVGAAIGERLGIIGAQMAERSIESLAELPEATDPVRAAAIGALLQTAPAAFISQQSELFALIGLEGFRLTLETGRTPYLPGVLALYALITRNLDPDPRVGVRAQLAGRAPRRARQPAAAGQRRVRALVVRPSLGRADPRDPAAHPRPRRGRLHPRRRDDGLLQHRRLRHAAGRQRRAAGRGDRRRAPPRASGSPAASPPRPSTAPTRSSSPRRSRAAPPARPRSPTPRARARSTRSATSPRSATPTSSTSRATT